MLLGGERCLTLPPEAAQLRAGARARARLRRHVAVCTASKASPEWAKRRSSAGASRHSWRRRCSPRHPSGAGLGPDAPRGPGGPKRALARRIVLARARTALRPSRGPQLRCASRSCTQLQTRKTARARVLGNCGSDTCVGRPSRGGGRSPISPAFGNRIRAEVGRSWAKSGAKLAPRVGLQSRESRSRPMPLGASALHVESGGRPQPARVRPAGNSPKHVGAQGSDIPFFRRRLWLRRSTTHRSGSNSVP